MIKRKNLASFLFFHQHGNSISILSVKVELTDVTNPLKCHGIELDAQKKQAFSSRILSSSGFGIRGQSVKPSDISA
jgi:hypothetical protein